MNPSSSISCSNHTEPVNSLQAEQAQLLISNLPLSVLTHALLALLLASVQFQVVPISNIHIWLVLIATILIIRSLLAIVWRYYKSTVSNNEQYWLFLFRLTVIASGTIWGIGSVILSPNEILEHQIFVGFVLAGLCAAAISSLSIDRVSTIGFLAPALLSYMCYIISQGTSIHYSMSAMIFLFLLFILASARQSGHRLQKYFNLRIKAGEAESRFRLILEYSPIATRITDLETHRVIFANQSYIDLIGTTKDRVIGIDPTRYYANSEDYADILERLDKGEHITNRLVELNVSDKTQILKWALASYIQIEYQGKPAVLGWLYDITDRKKMEEEIQHLAYHDPLTNLPNRLLLNDRIHQALSIAQRDNFSVALMFIDLDKFKPINDNYGHEVGDLLLKAVADRIRQCLRKSDSVARLGGDEFIILLPEVENAEAAFEVAEKIHTSINQPFELNELQINISSSTGLALYPEHANEENQLIQYADAAMYYAKNNGKDNVQLYNSGMKEIDIET
ncbi:MAG: GGDEF domain-containing protein [Proteobacteria bacterium]|nr:sensor domain-containing diguanylate cyclase [Pseudomonadota bacterium]NOG59669.1 GGDEF domain-containing protein [Pseudomonadota bacterium]